MAFGFLAHDQGIQLAATEGGGMGHPADHRIRAEGETRHGHRIGLDQGQQLGCQQLGAAATEGDWLAVDVVLAAAA